MFIQHFWTRQHPDSWAMASHSLSSGFGSSGDGCCPLGVMALWPQNPGHRKCFLLCHCSSVPQPSCWAAQEGAGSGCGWRKPSINEECSWMSCWGECFGSSDPACNREHSTVLTPWVLLKGKTEIPCAFCFSGTHRHRHGSWVSHLVGPSHQQMHWVQVGFVLL